MYRQKGTGYARHGDRNANLLRGGGRAFRKDPRDFRKKLPQKMRRRAMLNAILAKIQGEALMVVDGLSVDEPKTKVLADLMQVLGVNRSCLLATAERDRNVYLSGRNLPDLTVRTVDELNAYDIASRMKMILTRQAIDVLAGQEVGA
jgi:large subunit ribosomal protein L4